MAENLNPQPFSHSPALELYNPYVCVCVFVQCPQQLYMCVLCHCVCVCVVCMFSTNGPKYCWITYVCIIERDLKKFAIFPINSFTSAFFPVAVKYEVVHRKFDEVS